MRYCPLLYVIRQNIAVPVTCPPLATNQPYSDKHGSIEMDLIARASHDHGLFHDNNAQVYYKLEEATRSTQYLDSIKPFQRCKDGRAAFEALNGQYAGADKWELELKKQNKLLHTRKWKGQGNYSLERFCQHHRNAFVSMQSCAEHVDFQLPNEHTRVGFLLDAIENNDLPLQAAMANIEEDIGDGTVANPGKRNDFEASVAYLLPKDPVARKRDSGARRGMTDIADLNANVSGFGDKKGIGKTGVHLCWHGKKEFMKLTQEQREELTCWREEKLKANPNFNKKRKDTDSNVSEQGKKKRSKKEKREIAAVIEKKVNEKMEEKLKEAKELSKADNDVRSYIMGLFKPSNSTTPPTSKSAQVTASNAQSTSSSRVTLQSILRRAKNN